MANNSLNSPTVLWSDISWTHMGSHSGLGPLRREVAAIFPGPIQYLSRLLKPAKWDSFGRNLVNRFRRIIMAPQAPDWSTLRDQGSPYYSEAAWRREIKICELVVSSRAAVVVLEGIEDQLHLLARKRAEWPHTRLVGISHQPPAWWRLHHRDLYVVKSLDCMIVLSREAETFWRSFLGNDRVVFIAHGIDADFFCPLAGKLPCEAETTLKLVFAGQWLRDFETLLNVIAAVNKAGIVIDLDVVVPYRGRDNPFCYRIAQHANVHWHAGLNDEELRGVYRRADLLMLPLLDSTANNALLECLACGVPAIVTDVGGVRDYVRESFVDLVPSRDVEKTVGRIRHYAANREELLRRGALARLWVEGNLTWKGQARAFMEAVNL